MKWFVVILVSLWLSFNANAENQPQIKVLTEHLPPMQIVENNKVVGGIGVEVVKMLLLKAGSNARIVAINWARAYNMSQSKANIMLFSVTRNKDRENQLKWVGSIATFDNYLWRIRKRSDITIDTISDTMKYRIAVPRNDVQHHELKALGFRESLNLVLTSDYDTSVKLALRERVDLIMGNHLFLSEQLKANLSDITQVIPVYQMAPSTLYIAFSRQTDDSLVKKFQDALEQVKQSQRYHQLMNKWQLKSVEAD